MGVCLYIQGRSNKMLQRKKITALSNEWRNIPLERWQFWPVILLLNWNQCDKSFQNNLFSLSPDGEILDDLDLPDEAGMDNVWGGIPAKNHRGENLLLFIGIIDILQEYGVAKKVEHYW